MGKNGSITEVSKTHLMFIIITFMEWQIEGADESREGRVWRVWNVWRVIL